MGANESPVNAYFVMDNKLYMKSGNSGSKYVTVIKPLKTQGFSDFDIANFSK